MLGSYKHQARCYSQRVATSESKTFQFCILRLVGRGRNYSESACIPSPKSVKRTKRKNALVGRVAGNLINSQLSHRLYVLHKSEPPPSPQKKKKKKRAEHSSSSSHNRVARGDESRVGRSNGIIESHRRGVLQAFPSLVHGTYAELANAVSA